MPRVARQKTNNSIYHVMCRSISEIDLFKSEEDKIKYLGLIKKYQNIHKFDIYCYCLMNNHIHLIVDSNGADISQIMHGINFSYAQYFNKKHKRHGHLFQDRFKSKIIKDERYLVTASAYIHNNPIDLKDYQKQPEVYEYSSLSVFLGLRNDPYELINPYFILQLFGDNPQNARKRYHEFVFKCNELIKSDIEFENEGTQYAPQRVKINRNIKVKSIIDYVTEKTNIENVMLFTKGNREVTKAKALLILLMKSICNYNNSSICAIIGNITQSNVSRLVGVGLNLVRCDEKYRSIFCHFV